MTIKMEVFFVAEIESGISANNLIDEEAKYIAGPFGHWHQAVNARKNAEENCLMHKKFEIVTQIIEVFRN